MTEVNWNELARVQTNIPDETKWDGISLGEAVRRCMIGSPEARANLTIFSASHMASGPDIDALHHQLTGTIPVDELNASNDE